MKTVPLYNKTYSLQKELGKVPLLITLQRGAKAAWREGGKRASR